MLNGINRNSMAFKSIIIPRNDKPHVKLYEDCKFLISNNIPFEVKHGKNYTYSNPDEFKGTVFEKPEEQFFIMPVKPDSASSTPDPDSDPTTLANKVVKKASSITKPKEPSEMELRQAEKDLAIQLTKNTNVQFRLVSDDMLVKKNKEA